MTVEIRRGFVSLLLHTFYWFWQRDLWVGNPSNSEFSFSKVQFLNLGRYSYFWEYFKWNWFSKNFTQINELKEMIAIWKEPPKSINNLTLMTKSNNSIIRNPHKTASQHHNRKFSILAVNDSQPRRRSRCFLSQFLCLTF